MPSAVRSAGGRGDLPLFLLEEANERVLVFDGTPAIVFRNEKAGRFLDRHPLPADVLPLVRKIHAAMAQGEAAAQFTGQICLHREAGGRSWIFRFVFREGNDPLVAVFFSDQTVSSRFDLNALRRRFRLTRRESDVLRHLLDGLKNLEIAEELAITEQTVKEYLSSVYRKVGVPDRFALLRCLVSSSQE